MLGMDVQIEQAKASLGNQDVNRQQYAVQLAQENLENAQNYCQIINHLLLKRILSVGGFFMLEDPWTWRLPKVFGEIKRLVKFEFIK
jgi:predicted membrane-bound dolichyl-phosphate-mannose-protein mannosyltransferase